MIEIVAKQTVILIKIISSEKMISISRFRGIPKKTIFIFALVVGISFIANDIASKQIFSYMWRVFNIIIFH